MKNIKRLGALLMAMLLVLAAAVPAMGEADTGTIKIMNATQGQTYAVYKVFEASYASDDAVVYYVQSAAEAEKFGGDNSPFDVKAEGGTQGRYVMTLKEGKAIGDIVDFFKSIESQLTKTAETKATGDTVEFKGLTYGYYYVKSTLGAIVTIDTGKPGAELYDKNETTPDGPDKEITAENGTALTPAKMNEAGVGSTEEFTIAFNAVNYENTTNEKGETVAAKVRKYTVTDTPTNLDIDASTVKVFVNGGETPVTIPEGNITKNDAGKLTVIIPWVDADDNCLYATQTEGSALIPVKVTYTATVLAAAAFEVAPNEIDVKYGNGDENDKELGTDKTETFTYKFQIHKIDSKKKEDLVGAKFQLKQGDTVLKFIVDEAGTTYRLAVADEADATDTIDMETAAKITITGLDKAEYTLVETKAPTGYNVGADVTIEEALLVRVDQDITESTGVAEIVNSGGSQLPATGGMGTTAYYLCGAMLALAAAIIASRRRVGAR